MWQQPGGHARCVAPNRRPFRTARNVAIIGRARQVCGTQPSSLQDSQECGNIREGTPGVGHPTIVPSGQPGMWQQLGGHAKSGAPPIVPSGQQGTFGSVVLLQVTLDRIQAIHNGAGTTPRRKRDYEDLGISLCHRHRARELDGKSTGNGETRSTNYYRLPNPPSIAYFAKAESVISTRGAQRETGGLSR